MRSEAVTISTTQLTRSQVAFAFVDISTSYTAQRAISELNGKTILDREVSVQLARQPEFATEGTTAKRELPAERQQEQLRARLFQQAVQAAAAAAQKASETSYQGHQSSAAPHRGHLANMNRDLSLDSLIVKILGKIWEPTISTQELRDLVVLLPAAVHSERAAHETKVAELEKKIGGGGGSKLDQSKSQKIGTNVLNEIKRLKTNNGNLKNDIKKLEDTIKQSIPTNLQHPVLKEINRIKSVHGGVGADIRRLEQAAKVGNADDYRVKTHSYGNAATRTSTTISKLSSILDPVNCITYI